MQTHSHNDHKQYFSLVYKRESAGSDHLATQLTFFCSSAVERNFLSFATATKFIK